ncbi:hypothetical protein CSAL01_08447 [Colletotrichum salicis]|uniref:Uncharacterized protein n=1 Tax=Colletotrichum salicis TaxID=1209931 RepID=A0A135V7N4_9PEZI|nr:hypothetical protein CSAL01_08447 [Colletotrichum salicis]
MTTSPCRVKPLGGSSNWHRASACHHATEQSTLGFRQQCSQCPVTRSPPGGSLKRRMERETLLRKRSQVSTPYSGFPFHVNFSFAPFIAFSLIRVVLSLLFLFPSETLVHLGHQLESERQDATSSPCHWGQRISQRPGVLRATSPPPRKRHHEPSQPAHHRRDMPPTAHRLLRASAPSHNFEKGTSANPHAAGISFLGLALYLGVCCASEGVVGWGQAHGSAGDNRSQGRHHPFLDSVEQVQVKLSSRGDNFGARHASTFDRLTLGH